MVQNGFPIAFIGPGQLFHAIDGEDYVVVRAEADGSFIEFSEWQTEGNEKTDLKSARLDDKGIKGKYYSAGEMITLDAKLVIIGDAIEKPPR